MKTWVYFIAAAIILTIPFIHVKTSKMSVDTVPIYQKVLDSIAPPKEPNIGPGVKIYETEYVDDEKELEGVQVPIPRKDRVFNTKGNCVWCTLETLGRYGGNIPVVNITKNPRDGGDPRCQGGSYAGPVRAFLDSKRIKYHMIIDKKNTDFLVRYCKVERRGVAFDIPGHMLTLVHYDPDTKIIKVIDNADRTLSIQTWSWEKFHRLWAGWAYVIFGEPDLIPYKYFTWRDIPIEGQEHHREYFPIPTAFWMKD